MSEKSPGYGRLLREHFDEARRRLLSWHEAGASGTEIVRAWTSVVDRAIVLLFDDALEDYHRRYATSRQQLAVLAQGGYGRGELNPASDLDLLFLHSWKVSPLVESVAEKILYTLWDTGAQVGHAVRSIADCQRLAAKDLKVKTALIDARFLCGNRSLYGDFERVMREDILKRNSAGFFRDKIRESEERHAAFGDSVYLQEPQLKEGEGGLRDLHTAFWMARVKYKIDRPAELVQKGIVTERELDEVFEARDLLWRVRNSLHFMTGKHQDQLLFELQEPVAAMLHYDAEGELGPVEHFLRDFYIQADRIRRFARTIVDRCTETTPPYRRFGRPFGREIRPGVRVVGRELSIEREEMLDEEPAALVGLFADAQRHGVKISPATLAFIRARAGRVAGLRGEPALIEQFLSILRAPVRITETLRRMYEAGILGELVPEFAQLHCMVIRDLHHIYTVDEHTLRGVHFLEQLATGQLRKTAPLLTQVVHEIDRLEVVYLAMLLHDIGKGHGHGHSERGAVRAAEVARRMQLEEDDVTLIEQLVKLHLLMSHVSQHRDIQDDREINEFARQVAAPETLKRLYVMTFADMSSVAPTVWNNWRDLELGELYLRTLDVFSKGDFVPEPREERAERIRARLRRKLATDSGIADALERLLVSMPATYFLSTPEDLVAEHARLMSRFDRSGGIVETLVRQFPEREFTEFTVCTRDRPGLFASIAGVLAANGLSVHGAVVTTGTDGVALDVFRLPHGELGRSLEEERWVEVRRTLEGALGGTVDVSELVRRRRRSRKPKRGLPEVVTNVSVAGSATDHYTLVEVSTRDAVGLLFAITDALRELECRIHIAKISTTLNHVHDAFYVTDAEGKKIAEPKRLETIESFVHQRVRETIAPPSDAGSGSGG